MSCTLEDSNCDAGTISGASFKASELDGKVTELRPLCSSLDGTYFYEFGSGPGAAVRVLGGLDLGVSFFVDWLEAVEVLGMFGGGLSRWIGGGNVGFSMMGGDVFVCHSLRSCSWIMEAIKVREVL